MNWFSLLTGDGVDIGCRVRTVDGKHEVFRSRLTDFEDGEENARDTKIDWGSDRSVRFTSNRNDVVEVSFR